MIIPKTLHTEYIPCDGVQLIEASAGTGKTYTITNLYLRLLLAHNCQNKPYPIEEILVVTFTDAATIELKHRIRERIQQAYYDFNNGYSSDDFIKGLMADFSNHKECTQRLLAAEQNMDKAAIYTIHGFCQKIIKQYSCEVNMLFSNELITNEQNLLKICIEDFWRKTFYPMDKNIANLTLEHWKSPYDLLSLIRPWINIKSLTIKNNQIPKTIEDIKKNYVDIIEDIKKCWCADQEIISQFIKKNITKNKKPYTRLFKMEEFVKSHDITINIDKKKQTDWFIYSSENIMNNLKKSCQEPIPDVFKKINMLVSQKPSISEAFRGMIINNAIQFISANIDKIKAQNQQITFDDLLNILSNSLKNKNSEYLRKQIIKQFPVALIDEFQDTDLTQYDIFKYLYINRHSKNQSTHNTQKNALFMIGDPKQAIYSFRGADIFTYMRARHEVDAIHTMDTNWRSSDAMVQAVNHLFKQAKSPFIYDTDIPFEVIQSSPPSYGKYIQLFEKQVPALEIWIKENDEKKGYSIKKSTYERAMAKATAIKINELLSSAQKGNCHIVNKKEKEVLKANNIAVLVRTRFQGKMIQDILTDHNIPSVYLSNQESIFSSDEAQDLFTILSACLYPNHHSMVKTALATSLLSLEIWEIEALSNDELQFEAISEEFIVYQSIWYNQGIFPMLQALLIKRNIPQKSLNNGDSMRRMTNFLQLSELLQSASYQHKTPYALLLWFSEQINEPDESNLEQQPHIESEGNLVKIITIFKSKGLEYDVVFLPFICSWKERPSPEKDFPLHHDTKLKKTILPLLYDEKMRDIAEKERLAEELRLLYVALTRSVYCCYVGIAPIKNKSIHKNTDLHKTAIGWLLTNGKEISAEQLPKRIEEIIKDCPHIVATSPPDVQYDRYYANTGDNIKLRANTFKGKIEKNWTINSYSSISSHKHTIYTNHAHLYDSNEPNTDSDTRDAEPLKEVVTKNTEQIPYESIAYFPKGKNAGTFIHELFEKITLKDDKEQTLNLIKSKLLLYGYDGEWDTVIYNMIKNTLLAPLKDNLQLNQIPAYKKKIELEFCLPIKNLTETKINKICQKDPFSANASPVSFPTTKGFLKGFIDLVFEHDNKWYILDYKSNWLGETPEDYAQTALNRAMIDNRYDLQYQLYTVAIHRLLKKRVKDYNYQKHFGGVFYLFVRGITSDNEHKYGIFHTHPCVSTIEKLDKLFYHAQQDIHQQDY